jgi:hypothetical protein
MKAAAPMRSGALRDSITASGAGLTQTVNVAERYAVFVTSTAPSTTRTPWTS